MHKHMRVQRMNTNERAEATATTAAAAKQQRTNKKKRDVINTVLFEILELLVQSCYDYVACCN